LTVLSHCASFIVQPRAEIARPLARKVFGKAILHRREMVGDGKSEGLRSLIGYLTTFIFPILS
jgi:hypothetical protein